MEEKYYPFFNSKIPELVDELWAFVRNARDYFFSCKSDGKLHKPNTPSSKSQIVAFDNEDWRFIEKRLGRRPLIMADYMVFYKGKEVWHMQRKGGLTPIARNLRDDVSLCLRKSMVSFDIDIMWSEPKEFIDDETGLQYNRYIHKTDNNDNVNIKEAIYSPCGVLLWKSTCIGGYA